MKSSVSRIETKGLILFVIKIFEAIFEGYISRLISREFYAEYSAFSISCGLRVIYLTGIGNSHHLQVVLISFQCQFVLILTTFLLHSNSRRKIAIAHKNVLINIYYITCDFYCSDKFSNCNRCFLTNISMEDIFPFSKYIDKNLLQFYNFIIFNIIYFV